MSTGALPSVEELYHSHARVVHGIALAHVGAVDADDVMQETFVSIQRGLPSVRDVGALPAWVCEVARNCARDWLRRRARRKSTAVDATAIDELAARPCAVGAQAAAGELAERVLALVHSLPVAYRETLILRLVEGLDGPAIAVRTGLTPGSLRVNLCRGMAMLRPLLEKEGWP